MIKPAETIKVTVKFVEEVLGTTCGDSEVYKKFIGSKAPTPELAEEEAEAIPNDVDKGVTIFPKLEDGRPFVYDYQWKGYFKDTFKALNKIPGSECGKIKAYKQVIDKVIFVNPRKIPIDVAGEISICQRPLRAQTMQGERIALAASEAVPEGSKMSFEIQLFNPDHEKAILEALDYGIYSGFGQWRNSGKGRFEIESIMIERS